MSVTPIFCDACGFSVKHDHGQSPRTFTFGLRYEWGTEELDITASDIATARLIAHAVADEAYDPGFVLIDLPRGGSGGWVVGVTI